jgi:hypothetical protein
VPTYAVTLTIADDSSFPFNVVLVPGVYTGILSTTGADICTIADGTITAFQIGVAADPDVTDPSPTITFDFVASGVFVSLVTATGAITIVGSALATINADSNPDVPTPQLILLTLNSTTIDVDAPARIAPVEGTYALGTWSFTGSTPVTPPAQQGGGMGCLPQCIDYCKPMPVKSLDAFARVLARGAEIFCRSRR